ncbi:hypothetical protein, partial [Staphylococcus pasteuri]|uniref:hypothetical protein n=1 Tax=Staphylococcus pasteuri TaxID=45972 RepID=UPI00207C36A2
MQDTESGIAGHRAVLPDNAALPFAHNLPVQADEKIVLAAGRLVRQDDPRIALVELSAREGEHVRHARLERARALEACSVGRRARHVVASRRKLFSMCQASDDFAYTG